LSIFLSSNAPAVGHDKLTEALFDSLLTSTVVGTRGTQQLTHDLQMSEMTEKSRKCLGHTAPQQLIKSIFVGTVRFAKPLHAFGQLRFGATLTASGTARRKGRVTSRPTASPFWTHFPECRVQWSVFFARLPPALEEIRQKKLRTALASCLHRKHRAIVVGKFVAGPNRTYGADDAAIAVEVSRHTAGSQE